VRLWVVIVTCRPKASPWISCPVFSASTCSVRAQKAFDGWSDLSICCYFWRRGFISASELWASRFFGYAPADTDPVVFGVGGGDDNNTAATIKLLPATLIVDMPVIGTMCWIVNYTITKKTMGSGRLGKESQLTPYNLELRSEIAYSAYVVRCQINGNDHLLTEIR